MRFSGQGLMSHTSTTTISRFFERSRGKALSTIWFGLSLQNLFYQFYNLSFSIYSWRTVWQFICGINNINFYLLCILNTIKSIKLDSREKIQQTKNNLKIKSWKRRDVLKDYRFYIVSLNMLAMPWIATGVFVYQSFIAESKMWAIYTIPKAHLWFIRLTSIITLFVFRFFS